MSNKSQSASYVGGFGNGRKSAETVAGALEKRLDRPVNAFTFSDWVTDPDEVGRATRNAHVFTHSAGVLALNNANFSSAYMLNPPLPRSVGRLVVGAGLKTARMFIPGVGMHTPADLLASAVYSASATAELAAHPIANFGQLREISKFDAIRVATGLNNANKDVRGIAWTENDTFFAPSEADLDKLRIAGIPYQIVPGEHDEVVLRPEQFLDNIDI